MLRDRKEPRSDNMSAVANTVHEQRRVRVLGPIPSDAGGEQDHCRESVRWSSFRLLPDQRQTDGFWCLTLSCAVANG